MACPPEEDEITVLLDRARRGDADAEARVASALEPVLRRLAARQLRGGGDSLLETGALMNEAWLRMCGKGVGEYADRQHFLRAASRTMRSVLVDRARRRTALKRGSGQARVELDEEVHGVPPNFEELIALDEAIALLEPEEAELAELRLFGGLSCREIADLQGGVVRTVERRWQAVAARLKRRLGR